MYDYVPVRSRHFFAQNSLISREKQKSNSILLTEIALIRVSAFEPVLQTSIPRPEKDHVMPAHAVGYITGKELSALGTWIFYNRSKPASPILPRETLFLSSQVISDTNIFEKIVWNKSYQWVHKMYRNMRIMQNYLSTCFCLHFL